MTNALEFVKANPDACIVIHPRHAVQGRRYSIVNGIENLLMKLGLKRVAIISSTVLLFVSGCNTRRHTHHPGGKPAVKEYKSLYEKK